MTRMLVVASPTLSPLCTDGPVPTDGQPVWSRCQPGGHVYTRDGPFPFTVAVWQEVTRCPRHDMPDCSPLLNGCSFRPFGAVVATVEVTGEGHRAEECVTHVPGSDGFVGLCRRRAPAVGWHTPTGTITRLDTPIPMERPTGACVMCDAEDGPPPHVYGQHKCCPDCEHPPASFWWAAIDMEAPTTVRDGSTERRNRR